MGSRGPFPLAHSTETLRGRNTFRPESRPAIPEDVQPPDWLDGAARSYWFETAPPLIASGRLRASMVSGFAILCQLAADCERLSQEVAAEGTVIGGRANPKTRMLRDARRDFLQFAKAYGLDPSSSARLPNAPAEPSAPADPLEAYILSKGA